MGLLKGLQIDFKMQKIILVSTCALDNTSREYKRKLQVHLATCKLNAHLYRDYHLNNIQTEYLNYTTILYYTTL